MKVVVRADEPIRPLLWATGFRLLRDVGIFVLAPVLLALAIAFGPAAWVR